MKMNNKKIKIPVVLCAILVFLSLHMQKASAVADNSVISNPRVEYDSRDCIYFGNYWQTDTNGDGIADENDDKTPIKWQILSKNSNSILLLADKSLDYQPYNNDAWTSVTWETSEIRKWLNQNFYDNAFSEIEKKQIIKSNVLNNDNPISGIDGGNQTQDYIYLPSYEEMTDKNNSYTEALCADPARQCEVTEYAKTHVKEKYINRDGMSEYWLRTPGDTSNSIANIDGRGVVNSQGILPVMADQAVRPILQISVSSIKNIEKKNIRIAKSDWDCIYFGEIQNQPILWRILEIKDNKALIITDKCIDEKPYHNEKTNITWENSSIRWWLNSDFYNMAFTQDEQSAIYTTVVENKDDSMHGWYGGENTTDKLFLLSLDEITNAEYGFESNLMCETETRCAYDYSGLVKNDWWVRSPAEEDGYSYFVEGGWNDNNHSWIGECCVFMSNIIDEIGIRPALYIDLSQNCWSYAGRIYSNGQMENITSKPIPSENPNDVTSIPAINTKFKDASGATYTVTKSDAQNSTVSYTKVKNNKVTSVDIPAIVNFYGITYKVTAIKANAFNGCKKLKAVTIGKNIATIGNNAFFKCASLNKIVISANVNKIGKKAFYGCKKLKSVMIKTKKLKSNSVGSQAFQGINKKAVVKVPKKQKKAYQKLLWKKGITKKMKIK